jgi:glycerate 2-kinase
MNTPQQLSADGKKLAERIFLRALESIDVRRVMLSRLRRDTGGGEARLLFPGTGASQDSVSLARPPVVIAFGKAAARMAQALSDILDGRIRSGLVVAPVIPEARVEGLGYCAGGHPYPNQGSLEGGKAALEIVSGLARDDLVIFLISGGGSAMLEQPLHPMVTLDDLIEFNRLLVTCGLPIEQINVLRKHVSAVKGGRLALRAFPAAQLTLFISDVPEALEALDQEALDSMVASGPTLPDPSTVAECYALAEDRGLTARLPASIRRPFEERSLEETPKPGDARFSRSHYCRLLSNRDAVEAARAAAAEKGLLAEVYRGPWDADFREVARASSAAIDELAARHPGRPVCLVEGGEVISPVTGPGTGGRNLAFVLYAAGLIDGRRRAVLSAGTDGRDGNSPASGAVADGTTVARARALGLDPDHYLTESDSYHFFQALGDALETGYTDNNVRDVRVWLAW